MLHYRNVGPVFTDLDGVAVSLHRAAGRKNRYGAGLFCLLHSIAVFVPPNSGRSLDCRYDDADHVPRDPIVEPPHGQPLLLELHPQKTRLIEFGRYATERRAKRGEGKPETFNFLGFHSHLWEE